MDTTHKNPDNFIIEIKQLSNWISGASSLNVVYADYGSNFINRKPQPCVVFSYTAKGDVQSITIDDIKTNLPGNHICLNSLHHGAASVNTKEETEIWSIILDLTNVPYFEFLEKIPLFEYAPVEVKNISDSFRNVINDFQRPGKTFNLRIKAALLNLCAAILENLILYKERLDTLSSTNLMDKVIRYMQKEYTDPELSITKIADTIPLSKRQLSRQFFIKYGCTIMQYLRRIRLEESCILLKSSNLRVSEISHAVSYRDPLYFSRIFHKEFKVSPSDFRDRYHTKT